MRYFTNSVALGANDVTVVEVSAVKCNVPYSDILISQGLRDKSVVSKKVDLSVAEAKVMCNSVQCPTPTPILACRVTACNLQVDIWCSVSLSTLGAGGCSEVD